MKIAIRNNDVFINYKDRFSDNEIVAEPYNYQIAVVPDDIIVEYINFKDFYIVDGKFVFNANNYKARIEAKAEQVKYNEYKAQIEGLIRERYSINDEIAIIRQRDSKPDEYVEYNAYCEGCKAVARKEVYGS